MKRYLLATVILCAGAASGCKDKNATAPDLGFISVNPHTVEVLLPFEDFVDEVQVFGGYGSASDLPAVVAQDFDGLNVRTILDLRDYPTGAEVLGQDGITRTDTLLSFVGGRVVLFLDTLSSTILNPVDLELFDVTEPWHAPSVSWEVAVDTAGDRRTWTQPGGGAKTRLGGARFNAFSGRDLDDEAALVDTVSIAVDSALVAALADPASGTTGLLVAVAQPGVILDLLDVQLFLAAVPSIRPDTVIDVPVLSRNRSVIFDPAPTAPVGWLRVGGVPSWRSVITMSIPRTVDGTVEVCGTPGCQVDLTTVDVNIAELVLTTRQTESAFQPLDTTRMELRRVLNPELLPKSPLGGQLIPVSVRLAPDFFSVQAGTPVSVAVTGLVRGILSEAAETDTVPQTSIALLSILEPAMIGFASFEGGGGAGAPALRLVYTIGNDVGLP